MVDSCSFLTQLSLPINCQFHPFILHSSFFLPGQRPFASPQCVFFLCLHLCPLCALSGPVIVFFLWPYRVMSCFRFYWSASSPAFLLRTIFFVCFLLRLDGMLSFCALFIFNGLSYAVLFSYPPLGTFARDMVLPFFRLAFFLYFVLLFFISFFPSYFFIN